MQNYATDVLSKIDERFYLEAKTNSIVNNGIDLEFNGNNAVTIYNMDVVAENNYQRSGTMRYGELVELGNGTQTFVLSQDKSFSISIDRGNREDSKMVPAIDEAVKRQVREVSVPNTDIYNIAVLTSYAITNTQGVTGGTAVANNTIYQLILAQQAALSELKYDEDGRTLWITPTNYNLLKRDPEFIKECDTSYADLKKGIVGMVDGLTIVKMPSSYYVTKFEFMITCKNIAVPVVKFDSVRTLDDVQGIDGWVAEGRRYHDFFLLGQKATGVRIYTKA